MEPMIIDVGQDCLLEAAMEAGYRTSQDGIYRWADGDKILFEDGSEDIAWDSDGQQSR